MDDQKVISLLMNYAADLRRQKDAAVSGRGLPTLEPYAGCAMEERLQEINQAIVWLKKRATGGSKGQNRHVHAQVG